MFKRLTHKECLEFEASLGWKLSSGLAWATGWGPTLCKTQEGWEYSSLLEHLPNIHAALGFICSIVERERQRQGQIKPGTC